MNIHLLDETSLLRASLKDRFATILLKYKVVPYKAITNNDYNNKTLV